jgi:hypothetical protein
MTSDKIICGIYRHVKGDLYLVEQIVTNCTNNAHDTKYVLYWSLKHGPDMKFVRDIEEFTEHIRWPDGYKRARFVLENP